MVQHTCPSREQLSGYALGTLPEDQAESVAEHVETCAACDATVDSLESQGDSVIDHLRQPGPIPPEIDSPECQEAIVRAEAIALCHDTSPEASSAALVGQRLGEYDLLGKLGQGGMGAVYQARHTKLKRIVALKVLPSGRIHAPRAVVRFHREMEAIGQLDHPNIVRAYDAREIDATHFLVMEYIEGMDFSTLTNRRGPWNIADACEAVKQVALGLQYAHERGLVHRDVKPSNLMLTPEGQVKILDLGLALLDAPDADEELTSVELAMGTADYMAPEQAANSHAVDIRADIYSLGCTLYKLLTGHAPFSGPKYRTATQKMMGHAAHEAPSLLLERMEVPSELNAVVRRMLAKRPDDRPATPAEVATALETFAQSADLSRFYAEAAVGIPSVPRPPVPQPSTRRRFPRVAGGVALALLGGMVFFGITLLIKDDKGKVVGQIDVPDHGSVQIRDQDKATGQLPPTAPGASASLPSPQELTGAPSVEEERIWQPGPSKDVLSGLVPRPAVLPGIHRWQVVTQAPFSMLHWLDWSPDGRLLACTEWDGVRVYDMQTHQLVRVFPTAEYCYCTQAVFSLDGHLLALGEEDTSRVRLVDVATGEPRGVLSGNFGVAGIAWSPDSKRLAVAGGYDGTIRVWTVDGKLESQWKASDPTMTVAWSPDGKWIAAGGYSIDGIQLYSPSGDPGPFLHGLISAGGLAWSPNGRYLAGAGGNGFWVCEVASQRKVLSDGQNAHQVSWSADSERLVVGHANHVQMWDVARQSHKDLTEFHQIAEFAAWAPQGDHIAAGQEFFANVEVWKVSEREEPVMLGESHYPPFELSTSAHGPWVATFRPGTADLRLWDTEGRPGLKLGEESLSLQQAVWSPEGDELALVGNEASIRLWKPGSNEKARLFRARTAALRCVAWSPNGKRLASGSDDGIQLWDRSDGSLVGFLTGHSGPVRQVEFSPDGRWIASRGDDPSEQRSVRIWKAVGESGPILQSQVGPISGFAWSPDGRRILTYGENQSAVEVWDASEGKVALTLNALHNGAFSAGFSPDGRWIWVSSPGNPNSLQLFAPDGTSGTCYALSSGWVSSPQWSPDGRWFAVHDWHGVISVFSCSRTEAVQRLRYTRDMRLRWSDDSRNLLAMAHDRTLRRWNALNGELLSTAMILPDGEVAWFSAGGRPQFTSPKAGEQLAVVVERTPGGPQELWTWQQFCQHVAQVGASQSLTDPNR